MSFKLISDEDVKAKEEGNRFKLTAVGRPYLPIYLAEIKQIEGILLAYRGKVDFIIKVL